MVRLGFSNLEESIPEHPRKKPPDDWQVKALEVYDRAMWVEEQREEVKDGVGFVPTGHLQDGSLIELQENCLDSIEDDRLVKPVM